MKNRLIYILFLAGSLLLCRSVLSQDSGRNIARGKVVSERGEELSFATILEEDKDGRVVNNTMTDMNGNFSLNIKSEKNRLKVSFLGFLAQQTEIGSKRVFNFTLKEENTLQEVIITAQQTVSSGGLNVPVREIPFAVQKISTKEFEGTQTTSLDDALQGRIAGLDIIGSGEVGRPSSMRIRGTASINSGSNPLIVMNNLPYDVAISPSFDFATANEEQFANLLNINPDDIEEITVLKDAAATSVWGSRGANGVLLITTKRGVTGPTRITYTYKYTGAIQPQGMNMLSGDDYTMLMKQAYFNKEQNSAASNIPEFNYDPTFSEYRYYNGNTDWRKEVTRIGGTHDHYMQISGGGDRAKFRFTGGYLTQKGTIIGQGLDRYSGKIDLEYNISERMIFKAEFSATNSNTDRNYAPKEEDKLLNIAYRKMPNLSVYEKDQDGNNLPTYYNVLQSSNLHSSQKNLLNPVAVGNLAKNRLGSYTLTPTLRLLYDFLDPTTHELRYEGAISFPVRQEKTNQFLPRELSSAAWLNDKHNWAEEINYGDFVIQSRNDLTWQPRFSEGSAHSLRILLSLQTTSGKSNTQHLVSTHYPSSHITEPSTPGYLTTIESGISEWHSLGIVSTVHYALKGRYIFSFNFRRDGSTRFGQGNKYGNFPGISLRWNISDEAFLKNICGDWLTMLSVRPSWGISGNQPRFEYMHLGIFDPYGSYMNNTTIRPGNIRLSDLRWEKTTGLNLGFDLAVLDNRYTMDVNIYRNHTKDLLFEKAPIPTSSGYTELTYQNIGEIQNNGWEINFHANRFVKAGNFSVDAHFNIANSVNTVLALDETVMSVFNAEPRYENGEFLQRIQVGNPFGSIYGYRFKGVYQYRAENYQLGTAPVVRNADGQIIADNKGVPLPMYFNYNPVNGKNYRFQAGDAIYEDVNHDGNIDELDIVYLGSSNPKFNGGMGLTLRYKQFSVNAFLNFRYGNKIINEARMNAENMYYDNNQSAAVNWRWRKEGDVTDMPRAVHEWGYNWLGSDRFVEDGSFLRLKYLTFNYALPEKLLNRLSLKQMSAYLTINNLYCFTRYRGVDPEIAPTGLNISKDTSITPRSKDITLSISIGF